ncbi:MAG TPA: hypothetical protein P5277_04990 [Candidatus Paceibacterota bacterium]|nr:hypothetical protein [Candidatus Paceibacterota bacterium]
MSQINDMRKWVKLAENMNLLEAEKESNSEKLEKELEKTDQRLMQTKLEKLNMLIKRKYYEKDDTMPDEKMFQFRFEDKGDHYEFNMPMNILFGKKTQEFCAKYWDDFFDQADINTSFSDNISAALRQAGGINLTMRINKKMTKEVESKGEEE